MLLADLASVHKNAVDLSRNTTSNTTKRDWTGLLPGGDQSADET